MPRVGRAEELGNDRPDQRQRRPIFSPLKMNGIAAGSRSLNSVCQ